MKKLGVVFGTFAPLHKGHLSIIDKAKEENEKVLVIGSGYSGDRGDLYGLPLITRVSLLQEQFKNDPSVIVRGLNEDFIPKYPNGWEPWLKMLKDLIDKEYANYVNIYVGELIYKEKINDLEPTYNVICLNRKELPISGTLIRANPELYIDYIANSFKDTMTKGFDYNVSDYSKQHSDNK